MYLVDKSDYEIFLYYLKGMMTAEELEELTGIFEFKIVDYADVARVFMEFVHKGYKCDKKYMNHRQKYLVYARR